MNTSPSPATSALARIATAIGEGVMSLECSARIEDSTVTLTTAQLDLAVYEDADTTIFSAHWRDVLIEWRFTSCAGGYAVQLILQGENELCCTTLESLRLQYRPAVDLSDWWAINNDEDVFNTLGAFPVAEISDAGFHGNLIAGAFPDSSGTGLFLGTLLPQRYLHTYHVQMIESGLSFSATTSYPEGLRSQTRLESETTWICASRSVCAAIETFAAFIPPMPDMVQPIGWNSWDYYFSSVALDDLIENMEAIRKDPRLAKQIRYIVVDMGWEHCAGEWEPNYRFPGGMEHTAQLIRDNGFVPGIWLAPIHVAPLSYTALRLPELLVKNEHGDPQVVDGGMYMLDPTHPSGRALLTRTYSRLYDAGFRLFKIDYVSCILQAKHFFDPGKGHYAVLRELIAIIRQCVTEESHLIGCSLPPECGPGVVDSGRIAVDIHNQWGHVEWIVEHLSVRYWLHGRVWLNDPDFLIVRGSDTSTETQTNVLNPRTNDPHPGRWRSGPVFSGEEAQTWASVVMLTGGSIFLSDRLTRLNDAGRQMLYRAIEQALPISAVPLDLCDGRHPALWLQSHATQRRLTVINWADHVAEVVVDLARYGQGCPSTARSLWSDVIYRSTGNMLRIRIPAHGSEVLSWSEIGIV